METRIVSPYRYSIINSCLNVKFMIRNIMVVRYRLTITFVNCWFTRTFEGQVLWLLNHFHSGIHNSILRSFYGAYDYCTIWLLVLILLLILWCFLTKNRKFLRKRFLDLIFEFYFSYYLQSGYPKYSAHAKVLALSKLRIHHFLL